MIARSESHPWMGHPARSAPIDRIIGRSETKKHRQECLCHKRLGLGDPRETQASPTGYAWVTQESNGRSALFAPEVEKAGRGEEMTLLGVSAIYDLL